MRVDHRLRLLRRGGVVEIHQRLAVHVLLQNREVRADLLDVESERRLAASRVRTARAADAHPTSCQLRSPIIVGSAGWRVAAHDASMQCSAYRATAPASCGRCTRWRRRSSRLRAAASSDAARAQVEQRLLVELADRRAVRALHVVGVDLQLRLGVDLRVVGEQQVMVGLLGVGLLRVLADDDPAVEDAVRVPSRMPL